MIRLISILQMPDTRYMHRPIAIVACFIFRLLLRFEIPMFLAVRNYDEMGTGSLRISAFWPVLNKCSRH